jgi:hypothetical protein
VFIGFADDTSQHTRRFASASWVIFTPQGQLLSSRGICLGDATNNVAEYSIVIEFLSTLFGAAGSVATTCIASGRGRCLVLENFARRTGPTYVHKQTHSCQIL